MVSHISRNATKCIITYNYYTVITLAFESELRKDQECLAEGRTTENVKRTRDLRNQNEISGIRTTNYEIAHIYLQTNDTDTVKNEPIFPKKSTKVFKFDKIKQNLSCFGRRRGASTLRIGTGRVGGVAMLIQLRSPPGGSVRGERANFTRLVLCCIEDKFCK